MVRTKSKKQEGYVGVYWDETLPTVTAMSKFELKWNAETVAVRGQTITIQADPKHFSTFVRCKNSGGAYFIAKLSDFDFHERSFLEIIISNRIPWIKRGLINRIEGFDAPEGEDFQLF